MSPPPWGILLSSGPKPATLSTSQMLQAKLSYHGAWGTRRAWGPWFCYDLGLGRVRGGLVAHCPTTPHLHLSSSHIGGALPGCWALSSTLPPRGTVVGGPVLAFGFKDGPEAPPPPPPQPGAWSGQVALCPKAQGPSQPSAETFSPLTRQPPYQALL